MLKIKFGGTYYKTLRKTLEEQPELSITIDQKIKYFQKNFKDTRLDNHSLTGRMGNKCAFSITEDIRIVYEWLGKNTVRFLAIGGHSQVYRKQVS